jgi:hypothetical protein
LISYCKALLGCPLFAWIGPRMLLRDPNLCMSLAMQFSRRRKSERHPFLRGWVRKVHHRPSGRQRDSIALARGKATDTSGGPTRGVPMGKQA